MSPNDAMNIRRRRSSSVGPTGQEERRRLGEEAALRLEDGHDGRSEEARGLELVGQEMVRADAPRSLGPDAERLANGEASIPVTPRRQLTSGSRDGLSFDDAGREISARVKPLFSKGQLETLKAAQARSPQLYGLGGDDGGPVPRLPARAASPGMRGKSLEHAERPEHYRMDSTTEDEEAQQKKADEIMWHWHMGREIKELGLRLRASQEENGRLRRELLELKNQQDAHVKFHTPEEEKTGSKPVARETLREKTGKGTSAKATADSEPIPSPTSAQPTQPPKSDNERTLEFMMLIMTSMQEMQRKVDERDNNKDMVNGVEVVRAGAGELPQLGEWDAVEGPLRMGDWLTMLEPIIWAS